MGEGPGRTLLTVLQRELVHSLHDATTALGAQLAALAPDPGWAGTPFAGLVLEAITPVDPVLGLLTGLSTQDQGAGGTVAGLRGWRDSVAPDAPRGVAYIARDVSGAALLVTITAAAPTLVLRAAGLTGQRIDILLGNGWSLAVSGAVSGVLEVALDPDRSPELRASTPDDRVEVEFRRSGKGELFGVDGGPSVLFGAATVSGRIEVAADGSLQRRGGLTLHGGEVRLAPGFVQGIIPIDLRHPLDLEIAVDPADGFTLAASPSLRTRLAGAGGDRWLDLAADVVIDAGGAAALRIQALTSLSIDLPGAPVRVHVEGIGLSLPIPLRRGVAPLPDLAGLLPLLPNGAGVALELPIITGSGALSLINGGPDIAGALAVRIPPMSASAFAVLSPARADTPLSFLAILGATFPPPGIQIGFGFAVSGVGGVVGVNRRIDREALIRAVSDGSVAQLLFSHRSEQGRGGCDRRVAGDLPGGPRIGRGGADVPDAGVGGSSACRRRYCWRCPARSG